MMNAIIIAVQMRLRVLNLASTNQYYTLRIWLSTRMGKLKTEGSFSYRRWLSRLTGILCSRFARIETAQEWLGHSSTARTRAFIDAEDYREKANGNECKFLFCQLYFEVGSPLVSIDFTDSRMENRG
jgi:hypothetical protein